MLTYDELTELREKLASREIAFEQAKELYWRDYKEGKRAWHTKDWKERRDKIIKDKCQICGSGETLTLQHFSHPKKYYEYERDVTTKRAKYFIESNDIFDEDEFRERILKEYEYSPVPLCPKCESRYPNRRMRKTPQYLCTECRHEFDEPIFRSADELITAFFENQEVAEVRDKCFTSKDKWRNKHKLSQAKYWFLRDKSKNKNIIEIEKEAFMLYLDDNIKYLSFEDTITACKKCAFNFDINDLELCPNCKEFYKGIKYPTCIQCLPEEKRKAALESIEAGKKWQAMHKRLGID